MIHIDGAQGEGGGQILRTSLTLSVITGQEMQISHIRARRKKPGLMAQHLQAVNAAAAVSRAHVEGARLGSQNLFFRPSGIFPGRYRFEIGTAGSTSLVLQTVLLPLALAPKASTVEITGGTHVAWSPCFHYLALHWLPYLEKIGLPVRLQMERAGFYPRGGGRIIASIPPAQGLSPLSLTDRGLLKSISCLSAVANLPLSIAERQSRRACERLEEFKDRINSENLTLPAFGRGTMLLLLAEFEGSRCCYYALGERGKPAERVADEAADALLGFMRSFGAIDEYLADQLLLPLALCAGKSELCAAATTRHLLTNMGIIQQFLPARITIEGTIGLPGRVVIDGSPLRPFREPAPRP